MKKNIILTAFSLLLLYGCTGDMERIQTGTNTEELIYADAAKTRQILNNLYARTRLTQGSFSSFSGDGVTFLDCATDNAYAPIEYSSAHTHGKSTMSASDIAMNGGHPWTFYYNSIRNATLFIQKVDNRYCLMKKKPPQNYKRVSDGRCIMQNYTVGTEESCCWEMKSSLLPTWTVRVQLQKQPSTISFPNWQMLHHNFH